jgi:hypothetical protein
VRKSQIKIWVSPKTGKNFGGWNIHINSKEDYSEFIGNKRKTMLLNIALLILIVGTVIIERSAQTQKSSDNFVPVKVEIQKPEVKRK